PCEIKSRLFGRSIFVHITHQYLDFAKQLSKRIYDICDFEIARCDLVQHRREQEKIIVTNETNLYRVDSREQFLKMNGRINTAETTTENDDSFLMRLISYRIDHRVLSGEWPIGAAISIGQPRYSGGNPLPFVSSNFACATPLGPD